MDGGHPDPSGRSTTGRAGPGASRTSRLGARLRADPQVHTVRRPVTPAGDGSFDLAYVRTGPRSDRPLLVVPGGPGLASVLPYRSFRRQAARRGLDVVMVEHRGVGLSRQDDHGEDLPPEALSVEQVVDDLAAVLDDCDVAQAVVYGSSYGTYLAQGLGVRHPARVAGMVLDSVVLTARDDEGVRQVLRGLYRDGGSPATARAAELLLTAVARGAVTRESTGPVAQLVHEFAGPRTLERLLALRLEGRAGRTWDALARLGGEEISTRKPFLIESDLVAAIWFRELAAAPQLDGDVLAANPAFAEAAGRYPAFGGEPYDLPAALPAFSWPAAVVSGERDLRTPRPVAERVAALVPDAVLVPLAGTAHSALDTHRLAALAVAEAVLTGEHRLLPGRAAQLSALPRRSIASLLPAYLKARVALVGLLPRGWG